jgi:acetylornithine deacetylase/succinyl-diaminopimelate desuccinylase-like protein
MPDATTSERDLEEALYHVRSLLRIEASGPPGREAAFARYLVPVLSAAGVPVEAVEADGGRASLVARLSAHRPDAALLVSAPMDGSTEAALLAASAVLAMARARRDGAVLSRDLVLVATADREGLSRLGARHLASARPDLLRARLAIAPGCGTAVRVGASTLVPAGVAAKGLATVRVAATGEDAAWRLVRSLARLEPGRLDQAMCPPAVKLLDALARDLPFAQAAFVHAIKLGPPPVRMERVLGDGGVARLVADATHDTVEPVAIRAGDVSRPGVAEADIELRVAPGHRVAEAVATLRNRLGDGVAVEVTGEVEAATSRDEPELLEAIADEVEARLPGGRVVPAIAPSSPDALAWMSVGVATAAFVPVLPAPEGANEEDPWARSIETLAGVIRRLCVR